MMKKNYIKPNMLVEQIDNDLDLLAGSPPEPNTYRDANVGQDTSIGYGGNSGGGTPGGTRAKGTNFFIDDDNDSEW